MRTTFERRRALCRLISVSSFTRWKRDETGATAMEFGAVVFPFFMMVFGLVGIAFYFFIMNSVEKGMDQTARMVRTGQAQQSNMTIKQFKDQICANAGFWIKCDKLQIFPDRAASWGALAPQPCVVNGAIRTNPALPTDQIATYVGESSAIVMVTACYHWDLTKIIPFLRIGNMNDGTHMLQAATAFRTEPYAN
ncbi:MAG: TadE/TadG family type IV pilus assembly protein [Hyphomicrobium sp.]